MSGAATMTGAEVLRELLQWPDLEAIGLILPPDEAKRIRDLQRLEAYAGPLSPVASTVVAGLALPRFGLSPAAFASLARSYDVAVHCAQRETRDTNLDAARRANVLPVESWIQLLERNERLRLHHLSTAFTGGNRRGLFTEFDLDCGQGFHDAFERSKFEAEMRLRASPASDRVTIYRPSHVLGRAATGEAFELGGAYRLLATLASSAVLPGDGKARLDFVPADHVARSIVALISADARGTFHLASGWHASVTVSEAAAIGARARHRTRGARLLPRLLFPARRAIAELLHQGPVFDTFLAERALHTAPPPAAQWLEIAARRAEGRHWELAHDGERA